MAVVNTFNLFEAHAFAWAFCVSKVWIMNLLECLVRIAEALESIAESLEIVVDGQDGHEESEQDVASIDIGLG